MNATPTSKWPVVAGVVLGVVFTLVGVRSLLENSSDTHPRDAVVWVVGLALAHDLVLVPLVLVASVVVKRLAPPALRSGIGAALIVSGAVSLVAWPLVRGYGRSVGNPSIMPRNYGTGLAITLVFVWTATLAWTLLVRWRRNRTAA